MADFIARIKPRKSSISGESPTAADLEVAEIAVNTADGKLFVKHTDGSIKEISGSGGGVSSEGSVRTSEPQATTAPLAKNAAEDVTFTQTGRSGQFLKVESSCAAWVVFYSSKAARTADAGRAVTENPAQGVGVLMEVFFDQAETALITPAVLYFNNDANEGAEIYAKVVNRDPAAQEVTITATVVPIEGRALYEAEGTARIKGLSIETSSLATNASEFLTLNQTARSGQFTKVGTSAAARVIFYSTKASRIADSSRFKGQTPLPSSGVLMEVITAGAETLEVTPAILYQNSEPNAAGELYVSVTNLEPVAAAIVVSVDVVPIEGRGAYLSELHELLDVDTAGVVDGDGIIYDATASKWVPGVVSSFSGSYNDLVDVPTISGGATALGSLSEAGDVLSYSTAAESTVGVWNSEIVTQLIYGNYDFPDAPGEWAAYELVSSATGHLMIHSTDSEGKDLESLLDNLVSTPFDYGIRVNVDNIDYGGTTPVTAATKQSDGRYRIDFDPSALDPGTFNQGGYDSDNYGSSGPHSNTLTLTIELNPVSDPVDGDVLTWNGTTNRWENEPAISKATLKAEVAASTDFADFQSRIAAL